MPIFNWDENDMKYSLVFFPWIGVIIGALFAGAYYLADMFEIPFFILALVCGLIPLVITGGFHVDGFMDVSDALSSYLDKEKKLEILKDPHIGAFAVIALVKYILFYAIAMTAVLYYGSFSEAVMLGLCFVLSRCITGITSLYFEKAKKNGMLYSETKGGNAAVKVPVIIQTVLVLGVMAVINIFEAGFVLIGTFLSILYYRHMTKKQFGGVTGDTAGYLVLLSECVMTFGVLAGVILLKFIY